jgi:GNAT superfamily N-acetyltransferase
MQFELTEALADEIVFSMENQNGKFLLDAGQGVLVNLEDAETSADERFFPLPQWGPHEGFRLMERFTAGLRSPLIREELSAALERGKGVFRSFKDAVSQHPETEKLWFRFKERAMKREIIRWYNVLRETWGLALIGEEPEDTAALVLEDFRFRAGTTADREAAAELHRLCAETYSDTTGAARRVTAGLTESMSPWVFPGDCCLVAETAGGEFAACISAVYAASSRLHIHILEVNPEYRGLGLGESLLNRLLETADREGVSFTSIDLPAGMEHFARALIRESFEPRVQRYCRYKD